MTVQANSTAHKMVMLVVSALFLSTGGCGDVPVSFDIDEDAEMIDQAVKNVLDSGMRTEDIMETGKTKVSTDEMGEAVLKELDKLVA